MKHFISISDNAREDLEHVLDVAARLKKQYLTTGKNDAVLAGRTLAMIFEKPSLRTRVSFTIAMNHLGGNAMMLPRTDVGLPTATSQVGNCNEPAIPGRSRSSRASVNKPAPARDGFVALR